MRIALFGKAGGSIAIPFRGICLYESRSLLELITR